MQSAKVVKKDKVLVNEIMQHELNSFTNDMFEEEQSPLYSINSPNTIYALERGIEDVKHGRELESKEAKKKVLEILERRRKMMP